MTDVIAQLIPEITPLHLKIIVNSPPKRGGSFESLFRKINTCATWRGSSCSACWLGVYFLLVTTLLYAASSGWAYDDPFITFRYARNLAHGEGFVYNPGLHVQSTTTPLFTLILAAISPIWDDLPRLAVLLGAASLALGGIFLWDLARSWSTPLAGWTGLLLYPTFPLLISTLSSEVPLYLALCLGAFAFYARQKCTHAAIFSALAMVTRPDGALVALFLAADYVWRKRRFPPRRAVMFFLLLALPWFLFAWAYFGSPIPATLMAKQGQAAMPISQGFAQGLLPLARGYAGRWNFALCGLIALVGLAFVFLHAQRWLLFLAWPALYFLSYALLGVTGYFWYYAPLVPGFIALIGLGIEAIPHWTSNRQRQTEPLKAFPKSFSVLPILLIAVLTLAQMQFSLHSWGQSDPRYAIYRAAGEWLKNNIPQKTSIGALDVGIIGYFAQRPMVDFAGLLYPEIAARLHQSSDYGEAAQWAAEHYHLPYIVLLEGNLPQLEQGYLAKRCQVTQRFPGDRYNYPTDLMIYDCVGQ